MQYDIIGDIHGYADELESLLQKLGYRLKSGIYAHENNRKVVFLGDYIDRGPKIRETLHIVKNMCDHNKAYAIMGNHEFNAVCYQTLSKTGQYYRSHNKMKNDGYDETMKQFENYNNEYMMFLDWFKNLPLFMEFEYFRVIHALWDEKHINWIKENYTGLNSAFLEMASTEGTTEYRVIKDCLKGIELNLPYEGSYSDIFGILRHECRLKWWQPRSNCIKQKDVLIGCPEEYGQFSFDEENAFFYESVIPVFFGHYWMEGKPRIENPNAICLDYSIANKGKLVAYQSDFLKSNDLSNGFIY